MTKSVAGIRRICAGYPPKEAEGDPLEQHLDEEEDGEDHVHNLQDEYQLLVVLQIDVLETQRQTVDEKKERFYRISSNHKRT